MTREEIQQKLIEMAAEKAGVPVLEVTPATHFVNDLEFDSLDTVEYAMEVEDHFKLSVPDEEAEKLTTVGAVVDFVVEQLKAVPAA
ncbi:MAG: acyl carrier protein [Phycisphaerales bacterium]|jgi:acyl carrier protein|nr:acyl carrier protein [Phycisphaerales bacterium]